MFYLSNVHKNLFYLLYVKVFINDHRDYTKIKNYFTEPLKKYF